MFSQHLHSSWSSKNGERGMFATERRSSIIGHTHVFCLVYLCSLRDVPASPAHWEASKGSGGDSTWNVWPTEKVVENVGGNAKGCCFKKKNIPNAMFPLDKLGRHRGGWQLDKLERRPIHTIHVKYNFFDMEININCLGCSYSSGTTTLYNLKALNVINNYI